MPSGEIQLFGKCRSEFAPVMSRGDRYGKVDANADGVIEPQEFDAYEQAHSAAN